MSYNENAWLALVGELSAMSLLKLLSVNTKNNPIPLKYTGSRREKRRVLKAREERRKVNERRKACGGAR